MLAGFLDCIWWVSIKGPTWENRKRQCPSDNMSLLFMFVIVSCLKTICTHVQWVDYRALTSENFWGMFTNVCSSASICEHVSLKVSHFLHFEVNHLISHLSYTSYDVKSLNPKQIHFCAPADTWLRTMAASISGPSLYVNINEIIIINYF